MQAFYQEFDPNRNWGLWGSLVSKNKVKFTKYENKSLRINEFHYYEPGSSEIHNKIPYIMENIDTTYS